MSSSEVSPVDIADNPRPLLSKSAHSVHFYADDQLLIDDLTRLIGTALVSGDAAIVVATKAHREALAGQLRARHLDIAKAAAEGRLISLDAEDTLSRIMSDRLPDSGRFKKLIGNAITGVRAAMNSEQRGVVVFGEMVAILWAQGKQEAAIHLEELWNSLAGEYSFSLRCAYPMNGFHKDEHAHDFSRICAQHSDVLSPKSDADGLLLTDSEPLRTIAKLQQKLQVLEYEKSLRESERRFRLLVEAVQDYAIFMLDASGHITSWNVGAERLKGYKATEILGQHFSRFYPQEDVAAAKPQRELVIASTEGRVEDEGWRVRKGGSQFWANVIITAIKDEQGQIIGFSKVTRDFTERMRAQKALQESTLKLQQSEKSLRELSFHLLRMQDEERQRIGRDLHDSLGQYLSVLKMKLDCLTSAPSRMQAQDAAELLQCVEITEQAVKEVRTISYLLYPPMLQEMGLKSAISWYLDGFTKRSGIKTTFEVSPGFARLASDVELAIFRVLQESLTNVHRHSGSETAVVRLLLGPKAFVLEVSDQGKGAHLGKMETPGEDWIGALGVGLRGMRERMRQIEGNLELWSSDKGTTVIATVPLEKASPAPVAS
jgi:PAS domain S-box-containing protein